MVLPVAVDRVFRPSPHLHGPRMAGKHPKNDLFVFFFFRDNLAHFLETSETPGMARRKRQMALQNELWHFGLVQFPQKFIPYEVWCNSVTLYHGLFEENTLTVGFFSMVRVLHLRR